jgi:AcrR family transcriptional regulator
MASITRRPARNPRPRTSAEDAILAATQGLLAEGTNFTELGVQQISTAAGVSRSTFYAHFRDKTDLLVRLAAPMLATAFTITESWRPADGVEPLADTFLRVVEVYREHTALLRAIVEVAAYDETVRGFWSQGLGQFTDRTIALLREDQQAGRTTADVDPVSAVRVIVIGGERAIFDHTVTADPAEDATFARELARIWWYGVYRRPAD